MIIEIKLQNVGCNRYDNHHCLSTCSSDIKDATPSMIPSFS